MYAENKGIDVLLKEFTRVSNSVAGLESRITSLESQSKQVSTSVTGLDSRITGLDADLRSHITAVESHLTKEIQKLEQRLDDRIEFVDRKLQALDRLPGLIRTPKSFQAATELHSVSAPIRRRGGQMG